MPQTSGTPVTELITPSEIESKEVEALASLLHKRGTKRAALLVAGEKPVDLPPAVSELLLHAVQDLAKGKAVSLVAISKELTTQQAADILYVSRPFLIEQLEKDAIPYRKVGTHRRIMFQDLMAFKLTMDKNRLKSLEELSAIDQELGLGY